MKRVSIFLITIFSCAQSFGQILHYTPQPAIVLSTWSSSNVQIDSTVSTSPALIIWNDFGSQIDINTYDTTCEVLMNGAYPAALNEGQSISDTATWAVPAYSLLFDGAHGNWQNKTNKYLGVRVKEAGLWYYGWIRLDVNNTGTSVTIKDYAIYKPGGHSITAGQTSASSTGIHAITANETITVWCQNKKIGFNGVDAGKVYDVKLIDMSGKLVGQYKYSSNETISLSGYASGMYVAVLSNEGQAERFKICL